MKPQFYCHLLNIQSSMGTHLQPVIIENLYYIHNFQKLKKTNKNAILPQGNHGVMSTHLLPFL